MDTQDDNPYRETRPADAGPGSTPSEQSERPDRPERDDVSSERARDDNGGEDSEIIERDAAEPQTGGGGPPTTAANQSPASRASARVEVGGDISPGATVETVATEVTGEAAGEGESASTEMGAGIAGIEGADGEAAAVLGGGLVVLVAVAGPRSRASSNLPRTHRSS